MEFKKTGVALLSAGTALALNSGCTSKDVATRPNVVLILADDMGYSDLGCYGSEIATPNIDKLAANGMRMTQMYNTSRSCPTRASLLTGLYQHSAGVGFMTPDLGHPAYQGYLNNTSVTLAEVLKEAGYATYMSGKWHVGNAREYWPAKRGFDRFYGIPAGGGVYFTPFRKDRDLVYNDSIMEPEEDFYSTDNFSEYGVKFIEEHKEDKPFFLYMPYIAPHFPIQAHDSDIVKYRGQYMAGFEVIRKQRFERQKELGIIDMNMQLSAPDGKVLNWNSLSETEKDTFDLRMAIYAAQVTCLDRGVGQLIKALEEKGVLENTIVMFLSDNGGTHENLRKKDISIDLGSRNSFSSYRRSWANVSNTPFRMYKHWVHEGGISTPFIIHYPGVVAPAINNDVAHIMDIMPTLCELAKTTYPENYNGHAITPLPGKSLLPVFKGEVSNGERDLFWEHMGNEAARTGEYKIVKKHGENHYALYNVVNDRVEQYDLSDSLPDVKAQLLANLNKWKQSVGVQNWGEIYKRQR